MATSTPSTPDIQRSVAACTLLYTLWDYMCLGFAGLTQYSRRGVVVFKRLQNIIDGAPSLPHSTSRATIWIVSRCTITDELSTLTNNKNGFVGDNGGGTTTSKRRPRHRYAYCFHPIKGWYERQVWRRGRRRQRWDNVCRRIYFWNGSRADGGWKLAAKKMWWLGAVCNKILQIQSPKSTLNSNLSVVQNVTINYIWKVFQIGEEQSAWQWI